MRATKQILLFLLLTTFCSTSTLVFLLCLCVGGSDLRFCIAWHGMELVAFFIPWPIILSGLHLTREHSKGVSLFSFSFGGFGSAMWYALRGFYSISLL